MCSTTQAPLPKDQDTSSSSQLDDLRLVIQLESVIIWIHYNIPPCFACHVLWCVLTRNKSIGNQWSFFTVTLISDCIFRVALGFVLAKNCADLSRSLQIIYYYYNNYNHVNSDLSWRLVVHFDTKFDYFQLMNIYRCGLKESWLTWDETGCEFEF